MYNMNMHLLNCNKTDAEYLHVKFSKVVFLHVFFLPAAELHVTERLIIYVCYPKREEHLQIL